MFNMDMGGIEKGKKKKKKIKVDGQEYDLDKFDDTYHWSRAPKVKRDNNFYGHTKCQTTF